MTDDKIIARVFYPVDRLIIVSRIRHFRAFVSLGSIYFTTHAVR